jgi:hypothetical protein
MKGIMFAGCSFTWGQGLEYYSDLNDKVFVQADGVPTAFLRSGRLEFKAPCSDNSGTPRT